MRNDYEQFKIDQQVYFLKEQALFPVPFQTQRKVKQKIHFTNANTVNEKV